jgi:mannose-6-phosphate isomerase-like protein (cupin superfamily)
MEVQRLAALTAFAPDTMRKVNLFETSRFFCDVYCFEPGQVQKGHVHRGEDKVYFVLEGRGRFTVGREEADLGALEATVAPAGVTHGVVNAGPGRLVVLVFMAPHPGPKG